MCEVALGESKQMTNAFNVVDIPNADHQSIHGVGSYFPPSLKYIDGVAVPHGLSTLPTPLRLHYNEFIVYNPNQVKIKYLFKMEFHFKIPIR